MKVPEKRYADTAARSREIYEKDLEKSCENESGLAVSSKSKKTAAVIGEGTGRGWVGYSPCNYVLRSLQLSKTDI